MNQALAFIGLGIMGKPMARNLMNAGYELHVYARHPEKARDLIDAGARLHNSIADCVRSAAVVLTMLGAPADVEQVYFGRGGLMDSARPGTFLIDMTTSSPALAERIFAEGQKRGLRALDAPVTGGAKGAAEGTLSFLVGGAAADFERCRPLFSAMGAKADFMGPAGKGQHAKAANQILVAGTLSGICESFAYARRAGLDLNRLFGLVSSGSAASRQLDTLGPKIISGDDSPTFFVKYLAKDLRIAAEEARSAGLSLDVLEAALRNCLDVTARGMGDLGTQALIHHYEK
ncbi:NAD(P)-dependent oxidoreductase [Pyramidobacter sp.]|uniref:NAD(P)-dependent oxidoreductase n=1 Tax=Pyramidobacter sp. TaxID=1943581 RepID=UPI0025F29B82|nr:NAD(P)-dependent oxidoreductase [Pyramidobacter sp.]MCI7403367.1 NAD(P)-dependent oxidoreductase [Pyramidobacter sp.]MDY3212511.1 NAD(P)-dependent oxidoreductase [Pyramidobacter sp.]